MQEMIFGVGHNPMAEDFEEGEDDSDVSSFVVYVSDKKTWEEKHCCNDTIEQEVRDELEYIGFLEFEEAMFEPNDQSISRESMMQKMIDLGFLHDPDFEKFMASATE